MSRMTGVIFFLRTWQYEKEKNNFHSFSGFQENVACRPRSYNKIGTLVGDEEIHDDQPEEDEATP